MPSTERNERWAAAKAAEKSDPPRALELYTECAAAGDERACNRLGEVYLSAGAASDAADWFRRGGELGSADAWFNLSRLYGKGEGVDVDLDAAHDCMRNAASLGDDRARQFVRDALGEDPDATPLHTPLPPAPAAKSKPKKARKAKAAAKPKPKKQPRAKPRTKAPKASTSKKGWALSAFILLLLLGAAGGGVAYLLADESKTAASPTAEEPVATAAALAPTVRQDELITDAAAQTEDAATADASRTDAAAPAAVESTATAAFVGDGYPPSPKREGKLLRRQLGVRGEASSNAKGIDSANVHYGAPQALDGEPDTWWQEGAADNGVGEWIELRWKKAQAVSVVRLVPGYLKRRSDRFGDRWPLNNRIARLKLDVGGRAFVVKLDDKRGWHDVVVEPPVVADQLRVTIEAVFAGHDKRTGEAVNDSGISEVQVWTAPQ